MPSPISRSSSLRTAHFGPYLILRKIATGGMAEIFLAKQTAVSGFDRPLIIKKILPHLAANQEFINMFIDEARIAAHLTHPNIVQIFDVGCIRGVYYIAMEYIHGEDLRRIYNKEIVENQKWPLPITAYIIKKVAEGLYSAHQKVDYTGHPLELVHRDISPQNIIVSYEGEVKIVDFGVAKAANKLAHTQTGVLKGKYSYMSPEQAEGDQIDSRSDIFSLGIILYELTCQTRLFKKEKEMDSLQAVIQCEVPKPSSIFPGYPPLLEQIVLRALERDKNKRYNTAQEFAAELEGFIQQSARMIKTSDISAYMRRLFADKLAEELLMGGESWEEEHTDEQLKQRLKRNVQQKEQKSPDINALQHLNKGIEEDPSTYKHVLPVLGSDEKSLRELEKEATSFVVDRQRFAPVKKYVFSYWKNFNSLLLLFLLMVALIGGVRFFLQPTAFFTGVYFNSWPPGALIYLDHAPQPIGKTPFYYAHPLPVLPHLVRFELEGYQSNQQVFGTHLENNAVFMRMKPLPALEQYLKMEPTQEE